MQGHGAVLARRPNRRTWNRFWTWRLAHPDARLGFARHLQHRLDHTPPPPTGPTAVPRLLQGDPPALRHHLPRTPRFPRLDFLTVPGTRPPQPPIQSAGGHLDHRFQQAGQHLSHRPQRAHLLRRQRLIAPLPAPVRQQRPNSLSAATSPRGWAGSCGTSALAVGGPAPTATTCPRRYAHVLVYGSESRPVPTSGDSAQTHPMSSGMT